VEDEEPKEGSTLFSSIPLPDRETQYL